MTCLNLQPALVGPLSTSTIRCNQDGSASNILKIGGLIRANRRITVPELLQEVGISAGSVEEILHELKVSKVSARWVPWFLSMEHGKDV
jgi:hypothetical protein